jgi:type I restriction enzyme M protein
MARARSTKDKKNSSAQLGFEAKLWLAADKLRSNMDAAEYKHVVLGLIFLKYISDSFEEHHAKLVASEGDYAGANPEDPDEYRAENIFWVPPAARWTYLQNSAKQPTIGKRSRCRNFPRSADSASESARATCKRNSARH